MGFSSTQLDDLVVTTTNKLPKLTFHDVSQVLQYNELFSKFIRRNRVDIESGTQIQETVRTTQPNTARMRQLFETDTIAVPALAQKKLVPWRHTDQHWTWERREILMNSEPSRLAKLLDIRRGGAIIDLAELMELQFLGGPSSSTDEKSIWGIEHWIVYNATTGFTGVHPSGFNDIAGIDANIHTRYRNWSDQYANVTQDDLIRKMSKAHRNIRFVSPQSKKQFRGDHSETFLIYMDETTINEYERRAMEQNDSLGRDNRPYDDQTAFKRNAVLYLPVLDDNASETNPVYMLNVNEFKVKVLNGDFLAETGPDPHPSDHNTRVMWIDLTWNMDVGARNRHAVLAK